LSTEGEHRKRCWTLGALNETLSSNNKASSALSREVSPLLISYPRNEPTKCHPKLCQGKAEPREGSHWPHYYYYYYYYYYCVHHLEG